MKICLLKVLSFSMIMVLLLVIGAACGNDQGSSKPPAGDLSTDQLIKAGEKAVQKSCIRCHGSDLTGRGKVPSLYGLSAYYSEDELRDILVEGIGGGMPGGLVKGNEEAVIAYLLTLQEGK